jgi:hypothetical protein
MPGRQGATRRMERFPKPGIAGSAEDLKSAFKSPAYWLWRPPSPNGAALTASFRGLRSDRAEVAKSSEAEVPPQLFGCREST